ncbi:MAG: glutaredoxin 3 [Gammaproteobacteria bacterium]|nr:glutaredoxin 3 [Gammaproteobacteria bacterium]MDH5514634.1 glutaredoxin 3 [Gammaproteobacteria bacterium]
MKNIVKMYCTAFCPYCVRAEQLLNAKGVKSIEKIFVDRTPNGFEDMIELTNRRTVPQIYIGEQHIGGYDDLAALDRRGGLDPLLATG